jgi:hypothetical protein
MNMRLIHENDRNYYETEMQIVLKLTTICIDTCPINNADYLSCSHGAVSHNYDTYIDLCSAHNLVPKCME